MTCCRSEWLRRSPPASTSAGAGTTWRRRSCASGSRARVTPPAWRGSCLPSRAASRTSSTCTPSSPRSCGPIRRSDGRRSRASRRRPWRWRPRSGTSLPAANDDVPLWARKRVKAMADFLARLLHPDGEVPLFHGAALGVARPARELLATAAIVLHEPELAPPGDLPGVWPLLVVGDAGRRTHAHLPRRREGAAARALRRTGFYVL